MQYLAIRLKPWTMTVRQFYVAARTKRQLFKWLHEFKIEQSQAESVAWVYYGGTGKANSGNWGTEFDPMKIPQPNGLVLAIILDD